MCVCVCVCVGVCVCVTNVGVSKTSAFCIAATGVECLLMPLGFNQTSRFLAFVSGRLNPFLPTGPKMAPKLIF